VPHIPYFDNSECLRLLQNQPSGLIHVMDDRLETRRAPKKTDHTMVEGMSASSSTFKLNGYPPSILCCLTGARQEREIEKKRRSMCRRGVDETSQRPCVSCALLDPRTNGLMKPEPSLFVAASGPWVFPQSKETKSGLSASRFRSRMHSDEYVTG
jgi:hypothetical protein